MTITFLDSSGPLPNVVASRRFTATDPLAYACVRYFDPDRPGLQRGEEVVYRDGAFRYPYSLASTQDGTTYTVVRQGGWSSDLELHAEEKSTGAPTPALPGNLFGADAIWSLLHVPGSNPPTIDPTDYSGNSRNTTIANSYDAAQCLIPGRAAMNATPSFVQCNSMPIHLGALTIFGVLRCSPLPTAQDNWIYAVGNYGTGAPAGNMSFSLLLGSSGNNKPRYYAAYGSRQTIVYDFSTIAYPADGLYHFFCCMRNAAGTVVTFGLDDTFETSSTLTPPDGGSAGQSTIGWAAGASSKFNGNLYGLQVVPSERSQAEMLSVRKTYMGLA